MKYDELEVEVRKVINFGEHKGITRQLKPDDMFVIQVADALLKHCLLEYNFHGIQTIEDADKWFKEHINDTALISFDDVVAECEGDLPKIMKRIKFLFEHSLCMRPLKELQELIEFFELEDYVSDDEFTDWCEPHDEELTLEEMFIDFCAKTCTDLEDEEKVINSEALRFCRMFFDLFPHEARRTRVKDFCIDETLLQRIIDDRGLTLDEVCDFDEFYRYLNQYIYSRTLHNILVDINVSQLHVFGGHCTRISLKDIFAKKLS